MIGGLTMRKDNNGMSLIDISKFVNESKQERKYHDYFIETDNYVLMQKKLHEKLMESQVNWTATENKLVNKIDFSVEYSDMINEDDILGIIAEKMAESRKIT